MSSSTGSKFGAFLDTYNQGNNVLQSAAEGFISSTEVDRKFLEQNGTAYLQAKMNQISGILEDKSRNSYMRLQDAGNILTDIATVIVSPALPQEIKESGGSIIKRFFETARQTEDQHLLDKAQKIAIAVKNSKSSSTGSSEAAAAEV